ncbi:another transcription unit protein-like [Schistocerca nitens]|uniref:another transcription unit protein-like n=1 Tax=Schistocerca nitens TaxID=7011 RepID=UPI0021177E64|nr:another transcription unit protein-like [Schistocerca nitens]
MAVVAVLPTTGLKRGWTAAVLPPVKTTNTMDTTLTTTTSEGAATVTVTVRPKTVRSTGESKRPGEVNGRRSQQPARSGAALHRAKSAAAPNPVESGGGSAGSHARSKSAAPAGSARLGSEDQSNSLSSIRMVARRGVSSSPKDRASPPDRNNNVNNHSRNNPTGKKPTRHRSSPNLRVGCTACSSGSGGAGGGGALPPPEPYKMAFKAGSPESSSGGGGSSAGSGGDKKTSVYKVPRPRAPFAKRCYSIDTLTPPFSLWPGQQGGYPEHWRLASVYQHAFKPIEMRRKPLLASVYQ